VYCFNAHPQRRAAPRIRCRVMLEISSSEVPPSPRFAGLGEAFKFLLPLGRTLNLKHG